MSLVSVRTRKIIVVTTAMVALAVVLGVAALLVVRSDVLPIAGVSSSTTAKAAVIRPAPPRVMPNVVGKDVESVAESLTAQGLHVRVVLDARNTGLLSMPGQSVQPTELVLPGLSVDFRNATGSAGPTWDHVISDQTPIAGDLVSAASRIALYAGLHNGATKGAVWFLNHAAVANDRGPGYCAQCHTDDECLGCHAHYGPGRSLVTTEPASMVATTP